MPQEDNVGGAGFLNLPERARFPNPPGLMGFVQEHIKIGPSCAWYRIASRFFVDQWPKSGWFLPTVVHRAVRHRCIMGFSLPGSHSRTMDDPGILHFYSTNCTTPTDGSVRNRDRIGWKKVLTVLGMLRANHFLRLITLHFNAFEWKLELSSALASFYECTWCLLNVCLLY